MYGFSVVLSGETASFRDPGAQLYHETLPLPPVSTLIGIAGAAMGMPFNQAWEFFQKNNISVGVKDVTRDKVYRGTPPGKGLDLWKYSKIVSKEVRSDILKREFIFRPVYCLYYGARHPGNLEQLKKAFASPAWALSLGSSDDIAQIKNISDISVMEEVQSANGKDLNFSLIPGDQTDKVVFDWEAIAQAPICSTLELPVVKKLPIGFSFNKNGERKGCNYMSFTFVSEIQKLREPCLAYRFGIDIVPMISLS